MSLPLNNLQHISSYFVLENDKQHDSNTNWKGIIETKNFLLVFQFVIHAYVAIFGKTRIAWL